MVGLCVVIESTEQIEMHKVFMLNFLTRTHGQDDRQRHDII